VTVYHLKIDYDDKRFSDWLKRFSFVYSFLHPRYLINTWAVYETRHGLHIEIMLTDTAVLPYAIPDLNRIVTGYIEALLYSDLNKQLVGFVEGTDILFERKNGYERKRREDLEQRMAVKVKELEANPKYLRQYMIDTVKSSIDRK